MIIQAKDVTPGHTGLIASVTCDNFGASGVLRSVVGYGPGHAVTLHLAAGGCTGTVVVPWNADVAIGDELAAGVGWAEEGVA